MNGEGVTIIRNRPEMKSLVKDKFTGKLDVSVVLEGYSFGSETCDLVFITVCEKDLKKRVKKLGIRETITESNLLETFIRLRSEGVTEKSEFCDSGIKRENEIESNLDWLSDKGFVEESESGKIRVRPGIEKHIVSAAVQLCYDSSLEQTIKRAARCREFTEYKFVAVKRSDLNEAKEEQEKFKSLEVGLVSVSHDGSKIHYSPTKIRPISPVQSWRINEISLERIGKEEIRN